VNYLQERSRLHVRYTPHYLLCDEREQSTVIKDTQEVPRLKTGRIGSLGILFIQLVERAHTKLGFCGVAV